MIDFVSAHLQQYRIPQLFPLRVAVQALNNLADRGLNVANKAIAQMMAVLRCTHSTFPGANFRDPGIFAHDLESIWCHIGFGTGREIDAANGPQAQLWRAASSMTPGPFIADGALA